MDNAYTSKREIILDTAKSLFIELGVRGTTIAKIAEQAGIAKGSVYSYFSSKQDIIKALILLTEEKSNAATEELIRNSELSGQALIEQHILLELELIHQEKSFQQSLYNDESVVMDSELMTIVNDTRAQYHKNQIKLLTKAYDKQVENWILDIIAFLNGAMQEYGIYITLDNANFSTQHCAKLIAFSVNTLVNSLAKSELEPLLTLETLSHLTDDKSDRHTEQAIAIVHKMLTLAKDIDESEQKIAIETLTMIEEQLNVTPPNKVMIRALIANLAPYDSLAASRARLADTLDIELI